VSAGARCVGCGAHSSSHWRQVDQTRSGTASLLDDGIGPTPRLELTHHRGVVRTLLHAPSIPRHCQYHHSIAGPPASHPRHCFRVTGCSTCDSEDAGLLSNAELLPLHSMLKAVIMMQSTTVRKGAIGRLRLSFGQRSVHALDGKPLPPLFLHTKDEKSEPLGWSLANWGTVAIEHHGQLI